jgi:hypothetical protein
MLMMRNEQVKNILYYVLFALAGAVVTTGLQLAVVLAGTDPILIRPLAATFLSSFFGALSTAYASSYRPRLGSEHLSRQVNTLTSMGLEKKELKVVPKSAVVVDV